MIGDVPPERLKRQIETPNGTSDWAGIGGRYTGSLIPLPDATSGRIYGDTLPRHEAGLAALIGESGTAMTRPGALQRSGVDQLTIRDLDFAATETPVYLIDADD